VIEIFILSLIQGVTEFLPISSSSHLIIASDYLKLENNLSIDVSLHIGSFLAILAYFYKDILNFYENKVLFIKIVISSIPVMLSGIILIETNFIEKIRNIEVIALTTIVFGILLKMKKILKRILVLNQRYILVSCRFCL
jgi:undecaprenyl-diphosphatase